ncbi:MAG: thioredoxin domain-containing protein [Candidatus Sulfotelmatobacter sp.]
MGQLSKWFGLGLSLVLVLLSPLHAQTAASAHVETGAAAATPAPVGLAPDDATAKLTELVHAGKYAEAQQLTAGLLIAYPNDQRLIKAEALIDKLLSPAGSTNATPGNAQPSQPPANANAGQLTGMDKVEYNSLIELARQARQTTDLAEQTKLLKQFMDRTSVFLQKHPDQMQLWQLRAVSAIILNDPMAGYDAGQRLIASGAADSTDPNLERLLAQLNNKGWLDKQAAEEAKKEADEVIKPPQAAPVRGALNPTVRIVEFSDFECPACGSIQPVLKKLLSDFPQAQLVFQEFPLPPAHHPWAMKAAEYADCAARINLDKFWKYSDSIFASQSKINPDNADDTLQELAKAAGFNERNLAVCASSRETEISVNQSVHLGQSMQVTWAPTLFINGQKVPAGASEDQVRALVRSELERAKK